VALSRARSGLAIIGDLTPRPFLTSSASADTALDSSRSSLAPCRRTSSRRKSCCLSIGLWGLKELRPRFKRRVRIDDLSIDDIEREVRALRGRGAKLTVLAVKNIVRAETFFLEADVAIFEPADGGQPQLAVLIDRRPSEVHESSLETLGGLGYMEAELAEPAPDPKQLLTRDHGSEIAGQLAAQATTPEEREQRRIARVEALGDEDLLTRDEDFSPPVAPDPIPTVEFIDTFEHREYLQRALRSTSRRFVIISPWITASVVDTGFLESLGQLLRKGIRVHIGYGLEERPDDRPMSKADKKAEEALQTLSRRYNNFTLVKLGNTHSKHLLFDDTHVCGSFNWLSFVGDRRRTYRHEESTVVRRQDLVEMKYRDLVLWSICMRGARRARGRVSATNGYSDHDDPSAHVPVRQGRWPRRQEARSAALPQRLPRTFRRTELCGPIRRRCSVPGSEFVCWHLLSWLLISGTSVQGRTPGRERSSFGRCHRHSGGGIGPLCRACRGPTPIHASVREWSASHLQGASERPLLLESSSG